VWILGERKPSWKPGGPARQEREKAGSWLQTVEEDRCSKMAKDAGDGLATSSRDVYAQSECYVCCVAVIHYDYNRNRVSLYYLSKENKSFGTDHHLHSWKLCRAQFQYTVILAIQCPPKKTRIF
jgi:hypothetical protein